MAHNSLPNNLTEVCNGIINFINKDGNISLDEIMEDIKGPDFPLGGQIININDVKTAFKTGKSSVSLKVRGDYTIEKNKIIFTSIPYRTYRSKIKEQINKNIDELDKVIIDFDDESSVGENKLIFTVKDEGSIQSALNKLFSLTDLQTSLSYNMNFIVNGTPKLCSLYDLIKYYVQHQDNILISSTKYDKEKAEKRLHILKGLIAAIDKIDEVIALIKSSESKKEAKVKLINFLNIDEIQSEAILEMKLSKLTRIDKNELIAEKKEKEEFILKCEKILSDKSYRNEILIAKIKKLRDIYGDSRRTKLDNIPVDSESKEIEFVEPKDCVVIMTKTGAIKRISSESFKTQRRNGVGVKTQEDINHTAIRTNTIDSLIIFTDKGNMYKLLVNDVPEGTNLSKGTSIKSLITMEPDENPNVIYSIYRNTDAKYVLFVTKNGIVKKTSLEEYTKTKKKTGIKAIKLKENDRLASVHLVKDEDIILVTKNGYGIKFNSKLVPAQGKLTIGVKGIELFNNDEVVSSLVVHDSNDDLAIFSKRGLAKKFPQNEIPLQNRGGKGLLCYKPNEIVAAASLVSEKDKILILGDKTSICISSSEIPKVNRIALGNLVIKNSDIVSVSKI